MPIATPQGTLDFKSVDKVTFVGASSNTVIDTTTGSLGVGVGVGGPTSNLHVVGNTRLEGDINMLHTANTASIKLNSNVVAEFPRSKKLIKYPRVAMTSAALNSAYENGYRVTFSHEATSYRAWEAFDANGDSIGWHSNDGSGSVISYNGSGGLYSGTTRLATETVLGEWLGLELPESIKLQYLRLVSQSYAPNSNTIDNFVIYAKKQSGDTWTSLGTFTGMASAQNSPAGVIVNVDALGYYKIFAIVATKRDSAGTDAGVSIRDLQYFGTPEYDPEAHGTDVTVKSYPNVPNTDWLEVYYNAKDLADGALSTASGAITGLGGTTNNGTAYGGVTVSDGAFVLDGTNDYITTSALGFSGDQPYSISIWFRSDRPQTDMTTENGIYGFGYGNNLRAGLSWWSPVTNGTSSLRHWHDGSAGINFPYVTFLEDTWNHVVIVYPGGGAFNIRAWLNGVERMGVNGTGSGGVNNDFNWSTSDTVVIGDWYSGSSVRGQSPWDGKIANFRLFNRAITSDEIYQLYAYQKEYFGHGGLGMTLKAGRLGVGTSEPRAALDVRGRIMREYNPGEIIEELNSICDGSTVAVLSGSYTMANVTAGQDGTASYATITGSTIIYTPPPGTKRVYYRFWYHFMGVSESAISHHKIQVDGNDIYGSASCIASQYSTPHDHANFPVSVEYTMQIDMSSNNVNKGQFTSWTGPKTIRVVFREYNGTSYQCKLHQNEWWDGTGASGNYLIMKPHLTIRAIA